MLTLLAAFASAGAYGVSDFVGGLAARRRSAFSVVCISYPTSAVAVLLVAWLFGGALTARSALLGAGTGVVLAVGMWAFYAACAAGPFATVSVISALLGAGIPVTVGIVSGERASVLSTVGIAVAFAAVVLTVWQPGSAGRRERSGSRSLLLATLAGACFGVSFILMNGYDAHSGLWPLFVARGVATVAVAVALVFAWPRVRGHGVRAILPAALCVGILDATANIAAVVALQSGLLSVSSTVISLYPAVTTLLAVVILRERVRPSQVVGLSLAAAAIVALSAG